MLVMQFAPKLDIKLIVIVYTFGNELGLFFQVFFGIETDFHPLLLRLNELTTEFDYYTNPPSWKGQNRKIP
jgi:hypothetical protein